MVDMAGYWGWGRSAAADEADEFEGVAVLDLDGIVVAVGDDLAVAFDGDAGGGEVEAVHELANGTGLDLVRFAVDGDMDHALSVAICDACFGVCSCEPSLLACLFWP